MKHMAHIHVESIPLPPPPWSPDQAASQYPTPCAHSPQQAGVTTEEYQKILTRYDIIVDQLASARCSGILADKLLSRKFITRAIYEEALNVGPGVVESTRIRPMTNVVLAKVELNTVNYYTFIGALQEIDGTDHIVQLIDVPLQRSSCICGEVLLPTFGVPTDPCGVPPPKRSLENTLPLPSLQYTPHVQPPKCVSKYSKYLKDKYKLMSVLPDGDWPPSIGRQYTELTLIERHEKLTTPEEAKKMENLLIYGKVNEIVEITKQNLIKIADLFSPEMSTNRPVKVLMDGTPGIGKTTLTRKICQNWAHGELLQRYHLVVLLELRNQRNCEAKSIEDLFPADDQELKQQVIQHIQKTSGEHLLLIFDAYDELNDKQRAQNSLFLDIIMGKVVYKSSLLVTSRPYASDYLQSLNCINRHVELFGFTQKQIQNCILQTIPNRAEAEELVKVLKEHMEIMSLCYTPLHCAIMLYVYKQQKCTLPTTLTKLFEVFILNALKRNAKPLNHCRHRKRLCSLDELSDPVKLQFESLCKMSYHSFLENKVVFSYEDLESAFPHSSSEIELESNLLGLMTAFKSFTTTGEEMNYQFLHLNIQEFLTAKWASITLSADKQAIFIKDHLMQIHYRTVLKFLAGISELKGIISDTNPQCLNVLCNPASIHLESYHPCESHSDFNEYSDVTEQGIENITLPNHPTSSVARRKLRVRFTGNKTFRKLLLLTKLIYESQNFAIYPKLLHLLDNQKELSFNFYRLTSADCIALAHFLTGIDHSWKVLGFHFCGLTDHALEIFQKVSSKQYCGAQFEKVQFCYNASSLMVKLSLLPKVVLFTNTKCVILEGLQYPDGVPSEQIELHRILNMKCLTDLTISMQSVPSHYLIDYLTMFSRFTNALKNNTTLERLSYEHPHISRCSVFEYTAAALKQNTSLHLCNQFKIQKGHRCKLSVTEQTNWKMCKSTAFHLFQLPCMKHVKKVDIQHETLFRTCNSQACHSISSEGVSQAFEDFFVMTVLEIDLFQSEGLREYDASRTDITKNYLIRKLFGDGNDRCTIDVAKSRATFYLSSLLAKLSLLPRIALFNNITTVGIHNLQYPGGVPTKWTELYRLLDMKCLTSLRISVQSVPDDHRDDYLSMFTQFTHVLRSNKTLEKFIYEHPHKPDCSVFACTTTALIENTLLHLSSRYMIQMGYPCRLSWNKMHWDMHSTITDNLAQQVYRHRNVCSTIAVHFFQVPCIKHVKKLDFENTVFKTCHVCSTSKDSVIQCLGTVLKASSTISELNLSHCGLTDEDAELIAAGLAENMSVKILHISRNRLSAKAKLMLLKSNSVVSYNICDQGGPGGSENLCEVQALSDILNESVTLTTAAELTLRISIPGVGRVKIIGRGTPNFSVQLEDPCQITATGCMHLLKAFDWRISRLLLMSNILYVSKSLTCHAVVNILMSLENNISVEELYLSGNKLGNSVAVGCALERMLTVNTGIRTLKLQHCRISDDIGKKIGFGLAENNSLRVLKIGWNNIRSSGAVSIFTSLGHNTTLEELDLSGNKLTLIDDSRAVGCALEKMLTINTRIQILKLQCCEISDVTGKNIGAGLARNTSLRVLNMRWNNINGNAVVSIFTSLKHNTSLKELDLSYNEIVLTKNDSEAVGCALERMLTANMRIQILNLQQCELSDNIGKKIGFGLAENKSLKILNISENNIHRGGAVRIFASLGQNTTLEEIDLSGNERLSRDDSEEVGCALAKMLTINTGIQTLKLQWYGISDDMGKKIGVGLAGNRSLRVLNIRCNEIRSGSAVSIFTTLEHNSTLEELNLSDNKKLTKGNSEAVGYALEKMMTINKALKTLCLNNCGLNFVVLKHFTAGLTHTACIAKLGISGNNTISCEGWVLLFKALCHNSSLKKLDISWNKLGLMETEALAEMLACNKSLTEMNIIWCYANIEPQSRVVLKEPELQVLASGLLNNTTLHELMVERHKNVDPNVKDFLEAEMNRLQVTDSCITITMQHGVNDS